MKNNNQKATQGNDPPSHLDLMRRYIGYKGSLLDFKPRQVEKARTKFAHQMTDDETPLLFHDGSLWQNGGSGLLITNRAIYNSYSTPKCIPLNQIKSVIIEKTNVTALGLGSMPHLVVNGEYILYACDAVYFLKEVIRGLSNLPNR